jgi:hypothetical protein
MFWTEGKARFLRVICVAIICGLLSMFVESSISLPIIFAFVIYIILTYYIEDDKQAMIVTLAKGQIDMRIEMDNLQRRLGEMPESDKLNRSTLDTVHM